jgi:hypothetical protein
MVITAAYAPTNDTNSNEKGEFEEKFTVLLRDISIQSDFEGCADILT